MNSKIVRIGVTGHRKLPDEPLVRAKIRGSLDIIASRIAEEFPDKGFAFYVISPLAEGADRIVVTEVLEYRGNRLGQACLEVVLPMVKEEYVRDFEAPASRLEFESLMARALTVTMLSDSGDRMESYERAGRYVVDRCDILIGVWDGEESRGRGGTADIVQYAIAACRQMILIHPVTGVVSILFL